MAQGPATYEPNRRFTVHTFDSDDDAAGEGQELDNDLVGLEPEPRIRNAFRIFEPLGGEDGGTEPAEEDDEHDQNDSDWDQDQPQEEADGVVEVGQVEPVLEGVDVVAEVTE